MATYVFRCRHCVTFEVSVPMADLTATCACPSCGDDAVRVFTAPSLRSLSTGAHRAMDAAAASAENPQVVRSIPAGAPRPRSRDSHGHTPAARPARAGSSRGPYPPLPRS